MGRAVVVGLVVIILAGLVIGYLAWRARQDERREDKRAGRAVHGDLNAKQEQELIKENAAAADLIRRLLEPASNLDDITVLPVGIRAQLTNWLSQHEKRKADNL